MKLDLNCVGVSDNLVVKIAYLNKPGTDPNIVPSPNTADDGTSIIAKAKRRLYNKFMDDPELRRLLFHTITLAVAYTTSNKDVFIIGYSILNPKDRFSKKIGSKKAIAKLFEAMKPTSAVAWPPVTSWDIWNGIKYFLWNGEFSYLTEPTKLKK